ncbi:class I SAM-dependent methyltransferase [Algoriphagus antarcticus]|uniref:Methyltransferase family protein n=1 Tax=Algoriphagus antarcticus TaxID=238540 RepID=A0A3E0DIH7_9BACT|nr:methyltransferase domain-containing protein [Algoriphagus antarcticus]REG82503.1 methyltransferase family protein [Algoriphagus antarcticus]
MATKFLDPAYKGSINQSFREKRFNFFLDLLKRVDNQPPIRILDIGGTEIYWERMKFSNTNVHITLLNLDKIEVTREGFTSVKGDACDLSEFRDNQFDIVFSNSVIEHLFTFENQRKMANEVRRVGKYYYVQTPNYYFPLEPHWLFPFFQFLPFNTRVYLTNNFNLGNYSKSQTKDAAIQRVEEVKLLTEKQMKDLFPHGKLYRENLMGLTKSLSMYHFPEIQNT